MSESVLKAFDRLSKPPRISTLIFVIIKALPRLKWAGYLLSRIDPVLRKNLMNEGQEAFSMCA